MISRKQSKSMDANCLKATDSQSEDTGLEGTDDLLQLSGVVIETRTGGPGTSPQSLPSTHQPSASIYQTYNSSGWLSSLAFYDRNGVSVGEYDDHTVGSFGSGDHDPSNIAQFQNTSDFQTLNTAPYFNCETQTRDNLISAVTGGIQPHPTAM